MPSFMSRRLALRTSEPDSRALFMRELGIGDPALPTEQGERQVGTDRTAEAERPDGSVAHRDALLRTVWRGDTI